MALTTYELDGPVATITMDDGKVNALSLDMLTEIGAGLDRAEADEAVVVLAGREGRFSGVFDLGVLRAGGPDGAAMVRGGFDLAYRMLSFPLPVVAACTGHAVAMASFLLLSADYRIGAAGEFKIQANEVAIGLVMPRAAVEICRQRLTPAGCNRAVNLSEVFSPDDAVTVGYLDRVVPATDVVKTAQETAIAFATLDRKAHAASKRRLREQSLAALQAAIDAEFPTS